MNPEPKIWRQQLLSNLRNFSGRGLRFGFRFVYNCRHFLFQIFGDLLPTGLTPLAVISRWDDLSKYRTTPSRIEEFLDIRQKELPPVHAIGWWEKSGVEGADKS